MLTFIVQDIIIYRDTCSIVILLEMETRDPVWEKIDLLNVMFSLFIEYFNKLLILEKCLNIIESVFLFFWLLQGFSGFSQYPTYNIYLCIFLFLLECTS